MVTVRGKRIVMTKGDSAQIEIGLRDGDGSAYEPQTGDTMRFAMKKLYTDAQPLITKQIDMESMTLYLDPIDTSALDAPCQYVYDIQVTLANGTVDTVIPNGALELLEEVD